MKRTMLLFSVLSLFLIPSQIFGYEALRGGTVGRYQKTGAPVDIEYETEHVNAGETSKVMITFITPLQSGEMNITIRPDKHLQILEQDALHQNIVLNGQNSYRVSLLAHASEAGRYYLRIFVSMGKKGTRVFAVPVLFEGDEGSHEKVEHPEQTSVSRIKARITIQK